MGKGKERMPEWSEWAWDESQFLYRRYRLQPNGSYEFETWRDREPADANRFSAATTPAVDTLADTFANASVATPDSKLDSRFQIISSPSRFFRTGRVFKTLWTEPAGNVSEDDSQFVIKAKFGEKAYSKIRYFVVIREMQGCCLCLPLNTYSFQGTGKQRIRVEDYAAVYPSGSDPPVQGREKLTKDPFPIIVEDSQERLSSMSRLNFGRVYTVEYNTKVLKVGRIPKEFLPILNKYFVERIAGSPAAETSISQPRDHVSPQPPLDQTFTLKTSSKENAASSGGALSYSSSLQQYNTNSPPNTQVSQAQTSNSDTIPSSYSPGDNYVSPYTNSATWSPDAASYGALSSAEKYVFEPDMTSKNDQFIINGRAEASRSPTATPKVITGGTRDNKKKLGEFRIHPSKYFKRFHVFKVLWPEPQGQSGTDVTDVTDVTDDEVDTAHRESVYCAIRRFVIVVDSDGHCQCIPILTYGHQGTNKRGINPDHHAVVYTGKEPPSLLKGERPLRKSPIQVIPNSPKDKLSLDSRINYAKIYTVEHNVKVMFIGRLAPESERRFLRDVDETWSQRSSAV